MSGLRTLLLVPFQLLLPKNLRNCLQNVRFVPRSHYRSQIVGTALAAIRLYQGFVSPVAFSACKFHPSCSRYAVEAIERYGARRGAALALKRVWRCRPFAPGGLDPVPERDPAELRQATGEAAR